MRMKRTLFFCFFLAVSCKHTADLQHTPSSKVFSSQIELAPVSCQNSEYVPISLKFVNGVIELPKDQISEDALNQLYKGTANQLRTPNDKDQVRFDFCRSLESDAVSLKQIVWRRQYEDSRTLIHVVSDESQTLDLSKLVFTPSSPKDFLSISYLGELKSQSNSFIHVKGWSFKEDSFISLAEVEKRSDLSFGFSDPKILIGGADVKDPFTVSKCKYEQIEKSKKFAISSASIEMKACTFNGGGRTTGFDIFYISVKDSNPNLSPAFKDQTFILEGTAEKIADIDRGQEYLLKNEAASLSFRFNHHNGRDSFIFKLPHASYAVTTGSQIGDYDPIPGSPNPESFLIQYEGLSAPSPSIVEGAFSETHFLIW